MDGNPYTKPIAIIVAKLYDAALLRLETHEQRFKGPSAMPIDNNPDALKDLMETIKICDRAMSYVQTHDRLQRE